MPENYRIGYPYKSKLFNRFALKISKIYVWMIHQRKTLFPFGVLIRNSYNFDSSQS